MPRIRLLLPGNQTPWTKIPNFLLDRLLPELKDTELRLLLVIVRQTLGWQREGRPVIISYRTLMKRTGRGSEAVSKAIRALHARGVIHSPHAKRQRPIRFLDKHASKTEQQYKQKEIKEQAP